MTCTGLVVVLLAELAGAGSVAAQAPTGAITGTVTAFAWRNPHCHLYVCVTGGPFKDKEYVIELSSPVVLGEAGWSRASFKAGDRVTVHVNPSRSGAPIGLCRNCLVTVNGVTKPRTVQ